MGEEKKKTDWAEMIHLFPEKKQIDQSRLVSRLEKPKGKVDVILDTDTYNEIDDQFALAYLIKTDELSGDHESSGSDGASGIQGSDLQGFNDVSAQ